MTVLITDLDGTLIPLPDEPQNGEDLMKLSAYLATNQIPLVYCTGRDYHSTHQLPQRFPLPDPEWIICDVGSSLYRRDGAGRFSLVEEYREQMHQLASAMPIPVLREKIVQLGGMIFQEDFHQGEFKLSFYAKAHERDAKAEQINNFLRENNAPYSLVTSIDPWAKIALIDVLPQGVTKGYAIGWLVEHASWEPQRVIFAGDSGNDFAALTAGYRAILVGNAERPLASAVTAAHQEAGWEGRLFLAEGRATSGVLEGCLWFLNGAEQDA